jgi:hypothetical protein
MYSCKCLLGIDAAFLVNGNDYCFIFCSKEFVEIMLIYIVHKVDKRYMDEWLPDRSENRGVAEVVTNLPMPTGR